MKWKRRKVYLKGLTPISPEGSMMAQEYEIVND